MYNKTPGGKMQYQQKNGTKLYGFSQISLDRNTRWLKTLVIVLFLFLVLLAYVIWRIESGDILANAVSRLAEALQIRGC